MHEATAASEPYSANSDAITPPKLTVKNIKCSAKLKTDLKLDDIRKRSVYIFGLNCKVFNNFIVLKNPQNSQRIVLFKEKIDKKSRGCHANLTGISSFKAVDECIDLLSKIADCNPQTSISNKIDNISGTTDALQLLLHQYKRKDINLQKLSEYLRNCLQDTTSVNVRYHPDVFGSIIITFNECTVLLYCSGKSVILGGRTLTAIAQAVKWIISQVTNALKMGSI